MKNLVLTAAFSCVILASCQSTDKPKNSPTPPHVSMNADVTEKEGDRVVSQAIREAIVANESLSMAAKNIVIATNRGTVHLRGKVDSEMERQEIARIAKSKAGSRQVINHLEVSKSQ